MITVQCHNINIYVYCGVYDGELVQIPTEDLLMPDIDITEEEKQGMKDDITIMNTRKQD